MKSHSRGHPIAASTCVIRSRLENGTALGVQKGPCRTYLGPPTGRDSARLVHFNDSFPRNRGASTNFCPKIHTQYIQSRSLKSVPDNRESLSGALYLRVRQNQARIWDCRVVAEHCTRIPCGILDDTPVPRSIRHHSFCCM